MEQVVALLAALLSGGVIGAAVTLLTSWRERRLKQILESTTLFMTVAATAHGYRPTGGPVGLGEQIAAVHLIGQLGRQNPHLRTAASEFLERYVPGTFGAETDAAVGLTQAAVEAHKHLKLGG